MKDKLEYEEGEVKSIYMGRVEIALKRKIIFVWQDDEKISYDPKMMVKA